MDAMRHLNSRHFDDVLILNIKEDISIISDVLNWDIKEDISIKNIWIRILKKRNASYCGWKTAKVKLFDIF